MKISTKDRVYIQKFDADFILRIAKDESFGVPKYVLDEINNEDNAHIMNSNDGSDAYKFLVFRELESRLWLMLQFFIIDYDSYKKLSYDELCHLAEAKEEADNHRWQIYMKLIEEHKTKSFYDSFNNLNVLTWGSEIPSINTLANTRKKGIKFPFPEDYKGAQ